jgi:c-di-GMP-binding flagellar brake protein YcgR
VSTSNNRKHERAALDLYINKIVGDEPHLVRVRDISSTGVFLYKLLEPEISAGREVGLEIMLPESDEIIWAVGEVVRQEQALAADGMGLRFTRIAETDRQRIERYIATTEDERAA